MTRPRKIIEAQIEVLQEIGMNIWPHAARVKKEEWIVANRYMQIINSKLDDLTLELDKPTGTRKER